MVTDSKLNSLYTSRLYSATTKKSSKFLLPSSSSVSATSKQTIKDLLSQVNSIPEFKEDQTIKVLLQEWGKAEICWIVYAIFNCDIKCSSIRNQ